MTAFASASMQKLVGQEPVQLDEVLLPENSRPVQHRLGQLEADNVAKQAASSSSSSSVDSWLLPKRPRTANWGSNHFDLFCNAGVDWSQPSSFRDPSLVECFPGALELSDRQVDMLDFQGVALPEPSPKIMHINTSLGRSRAVLGRSACLSSGSELWICHRGRRALGVEHLLLMGIDYGRDDLDSVFGRALLVDLAGNAFDSASCLAALTVLVDTLAFLHSL